jgi:hypothetical protein
VWPAVPAPEDAVQQPAVTLQWVRTPYGLARTITCPVDKEKIPAASGIDKSLNMFRAARRTPGSDIENDSEAE